MYKIIAICLFASFLIFGWIVDAQISPSEKFTRAFPPRAEVQISLQNLETLTSTNDAYLKAFRNNYNSRLAFRTLKCSQDNAISRFDSISKISKLRVDLNCLSAADDELQQYVDMQRVSIRLQQPPLRPQLEIGKRIDVPQPINGEIAKAAFSSQSGVAVLLKSDTSLSNKSLISYDIKESRTISDFESIPSLNVNTLALSPNGRVLAVSALIKHNNQMMMFFDTETGSLLYRLNGAFSVEVWLPDISSALLKHSSNSTILIADFLMGKVAPYKLQSETLRWVSKLDNSSSRVLAGGEKGFYLLDNIRDSKSVEPTSLKHFKPKTRQYNYYKPLTVMLNGNVAIDINNIFLMEYNLVDGTEKAIQIQKLMSSNFEKINEEQVLVTGADEIQLNIFNVKNKTLSPINDEIASVGDAFALKSRDGVLAKGKDGQLWIGENFNLDPPETLDNLISRKKNEEILRLAIEEEKHQREIKLFSVPIYEEPRPITLEDLYYKKKAKSNIEANGVSLVESKLFGLPLIPANTKVELISVIKAKNAITKEIIVTVKKSHNPVFLILASCSSGLKWNIVKEPGSRLLKIYQFVGPYDPLPSIKMDNSDYTTIESLGGPSTGGCLTKKGTPEYTDLEERVFEWVSKPISRFQRVEEGIYFTVN